MMANEFFFLETKLTPRGTFQASNLECNQKLYGSENKILPSLNYSGSSRKILKGKLNNKLDNRILIIFQTGICWGYESSMFQATVIPRKGNL